MSKWDQTVVSVSTVGLTGLASKAVAGCVERNIQDQLPGRLDHLLPNGAENAGPVSCTHELAGTLRGSRCHGRGDPAHPV
jgi:hypothetical protein